MSTKLKSLIPDAVTIICLHELGLWEKLCACTRVVVPSVIVHQAQFYKDPVSGERVEINLEAQVLAGQISQEAVDVEETAEFMYHINAVMTESLHPGEIEALTLLFKNRVPDCKFCSADQAAVKALVLVGMKDKGLSLEKVLEHTGLRRKSLKAQYSERRFQDWVRQAEIDRIQGTGLARCPF